MRAPSGPVVNVLLTEASSENGVSGCQDAFSVK